MFPEEMECLTDLSFYLELYVAIGFCSALGIANMVTEVGDNMCWRLSRIAIWTLIVVFAYLTYWRPYWCKRSRRRFKTNDYFCRCRRSVHCQQPCAWTYDNIQSVELCMNYILQHVSQTTAVNRIFEMCTRRLCGAHAVYDVYACVCKHTYHSGLRGWVEISEHYEIYEMSRAEKFSFAEAPRRYSKALKINEISRVPVLCDT